MDFLIELFLKTVLQVWTSFTHNWPYLLVSVIIAVALKLYVDANKVSAFLMRYRRAGVIGAVAAAVTTPLCSCGTTAIILGMMAGTMPWAPIVAFMVSSPLTSPEGLVYSAGLFGWPFAIAFYVASILLGLLGGAAAGFAESRGWLANQNRLALSAHPVGAVQTAHSFTPQLSPLPSASAQPARLISTPAAERVSPLLAFRSPVPAACACGSSLAEKPAPAPAAIASSTCGCGAPASAAPAGIAAASTCGCGSPAVAAAADLPIPETGSNCGCGSPAPVPPASACGCGSPAVAAASTGEAAPAKPPVTLRLFLTETLDAGRRLLVMFFGFAFIGYFLNGLIPQSWVTAVFGGGNIYSVPLAATLGLPLYINSEASLPLVRALIDSGMSQGAALAFLITGAGTSIGALAGALTIARWRVIGLVVGTLWAGSIVIGYLYNLILAAGLF